MKTNGKANGIPGIEETLAAEFCLLAQRHHLQKVILFGSRARGDYGRASDIDLAVCGAPDDVAAFALDVEEETSTLLRFDVVGVSERTDPRLLAEIRRDGVVLYEKI